jgi:hypothetical protein
MAIDGPLIGVIGTCLHGGPHRWKPFIDQVAAQSSPVWFDVSPLPHGRDDVGKGSLSFAPRPITAMPLSSAPTGRRILGEFDDGVVPIALRRDDASQCSAAAAPNLRTRCHRACPRTSSAFLVTSPPALPRGGADSRPRLRASWTNPRTVGSGNWAPLRSNSAVSCLMGLRSPSSTRPGRDPLRQGAGSGALRS